MHAKTEPGCNYKLQITNYKLLAALLACVALSGCGYHTAGKVSTLPININTVAIPAFINATQSYRVEQVLTAAVVREFTTRTNYRVVNQPSADADATLHGTVTATYISPLTYDSTTGRLSSGLVTVNMRVSLVDRKGKALFENQNYSFRQQYQVSRDVSTFFQEESPAVDRLARDFARTLVSNILENY